MRAHMPAKHAAIILDTQQPLNAGMAHTCMHAHRCIASWPSPSTPTSSETTPTQVRPALHAAKLAAAAAAAPPASNSCNFADAYGTSGTCNSQVSKIA